MTLHFMAGFGQFLRGSPALMREAGYAVSDEASIVDGPEYATHALMLQSTASAAAYLRRTVHASSSQVVLGFAFRSSARARILRIEGLLDLQWSGRSAQLLGVSGQALLIRDAWMFAELVIDRATQRVQVWFNDVLDIEVALPEAGLAMNDFTLTWGDLTIAWTLRVSSLYCASERLQPLVIATDLPVADHEVSWELPTADARSHWSQVNLRPPEDDRYVQTMTDDASELFTFPAPSLTGQVLAVGLCARAMAADLGERRLSLQLGTSLSASQQIDTHYQYHYASWQADRTSASLPAGVTATH